MLWSTVLYLLSSQMCIASQVHAAKSLANTLGLQIGGNGYAFAGAYETKGLYAYKSGEFSGIAFFGTGGTEAQMVAPVRDNPDGKYRPSAGDNALAATGIYETLFGGFEPRADDSFFSSFFLLEVI